MGPAGDNCNLSLLGHKDTALGLGHPSQAPRPTLLPEAGRKALRAAVQGGHELGKHWVNSGAFSHRWVLSLQNANDLMNGAGEGEGPHPEHSLCPAPMGASGPRTALGKAADAIPYFPLG